MQLIGSLIWVTQTSFDVCAVSTFLSTSDVGRVSGAVKVLGFSNIYNRCAKDVHLPPVAIWFNPIFFHGRRNDNVIYEEFDDVCICRSRLQ